MASWLRDIDAMRTCDSFDLYAHSEKVCVVSATWGVEAIAKGSASRCLRGTVAAAAEQLGPSAVDTWCVCWELLIPLEVDSVRFPRRPAMGVKGTWRCRLFYGGSEVESWTAARNRVKDAMKGQLVETEMQLLRLSSSAANTLQHVFYEKKGTRRDGTWTEEMRRTIHPGLRVSPGKYRVSVRTHGPLEQVLPARRHR